MVKNYFHIFWIASILRLPQQSHGAIIIQQMQMKAHGLWASWRFTTLKYTIPSIFLEVQKCCANVSFSEIIICTTTLRWYFALYFVINFKSPRTLLGVSFIKEMDNSMHLALNASAHPIKQKPDHEPECFQKPRYLLGPFSITNNPQQ